MNLVDGVAVFRGKYIDPIYYPLGPPTKKEVGGQVVVDGKPTVAFSQNRYVTEDPAIALGMVSDKTNFNMDWGYYLDPSCLPETIREFWPGMKKQTRTNVAKALIEGATDEDVFEIIPSSEREPVEDEPIHSHANVIRCPVALCQRDFSGKNAGAALVMHVSEAHPDWNPEQ